MWNSTKHLSAALFTVLWLVPSTLYATPPQANSNQNQNAIGVGQAEANGLGIGHAEATADAVSGSISGAASGSVSSSQNWIENSIGDQVSINEAAARGGAANSSTGNVNISDESNDIVFAPGSWNATGSCMKGFQAGGNDSGNWGAILGFHFKDKDCWYMQLAAQEPHIETKARLLCASKSYRDAITYGADSSEGPLRAQCISTTRSNLKAYVRYIASGQEGRRLRFLPEQGRH